MSPMLALVNKIFVCNADILVPYGSSKINSNIQIRCGNTHTRDMGEINVPVMYVFRKNVFNFV